MKNEPFTMVLLVYNDAVNPTDNNHRSVYRLSVVRCLLFVMARCNSFEYRSAGLLVKCFDVFVTVYRAYVILYYTAQVVHCMCMCRLCDTHGSVLMCVFNCVFQSRLCFVVVCSGLFCFAATLSPSVRVLGPPVYVICLISCCTHVLASIVV